MPTAYKVLYDERQDAAFRGRVLIAMIKTATAIANSGTPTSAQKSLCAGILGSPDTYIDRWVIGCLAQDTIPDLTADATIQSASDTLFATVVKANS